LLHVAAYRKARPSFKAKGNQKVPSPVTWLFLRNAVSGRRLWVSYYSIDVPGDVLLALTDHLGTVRDLAAADSETGATSVVNHRVYDSYGQLLSQTDSTVDCLFSFTGRPVSSATGLQNNLNRWYDPVARRWVSEDPIGFEGRQTNVYGYCQNSPTNRRDPRGEVYPLVVAVVVVSYWFYPDTANAPSRTDHTVLALR
jgi:RHS repeat-associated protein